MALPGARDIAKSPEEKSQLYHFRLHPESGDPAEIAAIRAIETAKKTKLGLRKLFIQLIREREDLPNKETITVIDARKMMDLIQKIYTRLMNGTLVNVSGQPIAATQDAPEYEEDWLAQMDRYIDAGLGDDELKYYEDEE